MALTNAVEHANLLHLNSTDCFLLLNYRINRQLEQATNELLWLLRMTLNVRTIKNLLAYKNDVMDLKR